MRIIIIGCGRVGAGLAHALGLHGHTVTIVDRNPLAFERLGHSFAGTTVTGLGFDRDVLLQAGIERADGLATVTDSDEVNVVVARLANQVFRVPRVVARLYDPRKAEIYRRLGIQTISTTSWGVHRIAELLCFSQLEPLISLGNGDVELVETEVPPLLIGRTVRAVTISGEINVVAINRGNQTLLPTLDTEFRSGDRIHLAVLAASVNRLETLLGIR